jgi:hypothetical protein
MYEVAISHFAMSLMVFSLFRHPTRTRFVYIYFGENHANSFGGRMKFVFISQPSFYMSAANLCSWCVDFSSISSLLVRGFYLLNYYQLILVKL